MQRITTFVFPIRQEFQGPTDILFTLSSKVCRGETVTSGHGRLFANAYPGISDNSISGTAGPVPVASALKGGTTGTAYSETISAQGGTGPYTFAVVSGALPTGTSLNTSTGVISGTPSAAATYSFAISVTDANALTGSQSFTIEIDAPAGGGATNYGYFA